MRSSRRVVAALALLFALSGGCFVAPARAQGGEDYLVIVKQEQRLYVARGNPAAPARSDVVDDFPVTTGALWTQKGLETPSGLFTIVEKTNSSVQGGYDFSDTGDVTLTPYFMRLNVPNRGGIGIHTYTGRTLALWRFGATGGETTHGCIAGPPDKILPIYRNIVDVGRTRVWVVEHASEAFRDVRPVTKPAPRAVGGKAWTALPRPTKEQFYAVDMVRPDLGWAVSGDATFDGDKYAWRSAVYRWDGNAWTKDATLPYWLHELDMVGAEEGWAVGQNYMTGVRRTGGEWAKVPPSDIETDEVYRSAVSATGAENVWSAGGGGEIWRWNRSGAEWIYAPEILKTIRSMDMLDERFGVMVGGGWDTTQQSKPTQPAIGVYDGEDWLQVESPVDELWYGVDVLARDDAWAVGSNGAIIRWDGEAWNTVPSPTKVRLSDVGMISARDGWAVGDEEGVALHWDGRTWSRVRLPVDEKFYDISVLPGGGAMAVGSGGAAIQLVPAAQAEEPPAPTPEPTERPAEPVATPDTATEPNEPYATAVGVTEASTAVPAEAPAEPTSVAPEPTEPAEGEGSAPAESTEAVSAQAPDPTPAATAPVVADAAGERAEDGASRLDETSPGGFPATPLILGVGAIGLLAGAGLLVFRRR